MSYLKAFILSLSFLWRLPLPIRIPFSSQDFKGALSFFPLVGFFEGSILALTTLCFSWLSPQLLSLSLLLEIFFLRGIFHLDGLADTFDALSVKETSSQEKTLAKRLSVMNEPTLGTSGVVAIIMVILVKFSLYYELLKEPLRFAPYLLLLTFTFSRTFLLLLVILSRPAKFEGLGYLMISHIDRFTVIKGFLFASLPFFILIYRQKLSLAFFTSLIIFQFLLVLLLRNFFRRKFGGSTGDTFGAFVELSEVTSLLLGLLVWPRLS